MSKFIKTALLQQKERLEQQEIQLEEVRKGNPSDPIEIQLSKAGLYSHKNVEQTEKSFTEILEEIEKGFPQEILEHQLDPRRND